MKVVQRPIETQYIHKQSNRYQRSVTISTVCSAQPQQNATLPGSVPKTEYGIPQYIHRASLTEETPD